jgi:hypothetical protein
MLHGSHCWYKTMAFYIIMKKNVKDYQQTLPSMIFRFMGKSYTLQHRSMVFLKIMVAIVTGKI